MKTLIVATLLTVLAISPVFGGWEEDQKKIEELQDDVDRLYYENVAREEEIYRQEREQQNRDNESDFDRQLREDWENLTKPLW